MKAGTPSTVLTVAAAISCCAAVLLSSDANHTKPAPAPRFMVRMPSEMEKISGPPGVDCYRSKVTGIEFVYIPASTFVMGSKPGQPSDEDEDQRTIALSAFLVSRHPVTLEQYHAFDPKHRNGPYTGNGKRRPASNLTFEDACAFADWVSQQEKVDQGSYLVPTEAQFERAARSASPMGSKPFPTGTDEPDPAWRKLFGSQGCPEVDDDPEIGGLHFLTVGCLQFTRDFYRPYDPNQTVNPTGPKKDTGRRTARGGLWYLTPMSFRCADRWSVLHGTSDDKLGFRLVREIPGQPDPAPPSDTRTLGGGAASGFALTGPPSATTSNLCVAEAMRALQERADAVFLGLAFEPRYFANGSALPGPEDPPLYPPDDFYCDDLALYDAANSVEAGTRASQLVQDLASKLSDETLIGRYAEINVNNDVTFFNTTILAPVTNIAATNYLDGFQTVTEHIAKLQKYRRDLGPGGLASGIGATSSNRQSRTGAGIGPGCFLARQRAISNWNAAPWGPPGLLPIGFEELLAGQLTPSGQPGVLATNVQTSFRAMRGKIYVDLRGMTGGTAQVFALRSESTVANSTSSTNTYEFLFALTPPAEAITAGVLNDFATPVFELPCPPEPLVTNAPPRNFRRTEIVGQFAIIDRPFTNDITGICEKCGAKPIIVFTQPSNGTNLTTCVGITNILECLVTLGNAHVVDGEVKWELDPATPVLGIFTNTVPVKLDANGTARTAFIPAALGQAKIKATGQNLKSPGDHTTALPNAVTNIYLEVVCEPTDLELEVANETGARYDDDQLKLSSPKFFETARWNSPTNCTAEVELLRNMKYTVSITYTDGSKIEVTTGNSYLVDNEGPGSSSVSFLNNKGKHVLVTTDMPSGRLFDDEAPDVAEFRMEHHAQVFLIVHPDQNPVSKMIAEWSDITIATREKPNGKEWKTLKLDKKQSTSDPDKKDRPGVASNQQPVTAPPSAFAFATNNWKQIAGGVTNKAAQWLLERNK